MANWTLTTDQERDVLNFDPWGDRDATYRVLRQGFCRCRQPHTCDVCFGPVAIGDRVWSRTETDDGQIATFRICAECCWCIAHRYDEDEAGDCEAAEMRMYKRWEIGRSRAEGQDG